MPTTKKRTMITLEDDMYEMLSALAERDNQSLSKTAADIITKTLERYEDQVLYEMAAERMNSGPVEYLTHDEIWANLGWDDKKE